MKFSSTRLLPMLFAAGLAASPGLSSAAVIATFTAAEAGADTGAPGSCASAGACKINDTVTGTVIAARNQFATGVTNLQVESLKKLSPGTTGADPNSTGVYSVFGGAGSLSSVGSILDNDVTGAPQLPGSTGFPGRWDTSSNTDATWLEFTSDITITLGGSYKAFGFYLTDFGDLQGTEIEVFLGNSQTGTKLAPGVLQPDAQVRFIGLHSDVLFSAVTIKVKQAGSSIDDYDLIGIDDIVIGNGGRVVDPNPVPEPGTLALVALGLLAASRASRRSR